MMPFRVTPFRLMGVGQRIGYTNTTATSIIYFLRALLLAACPLEDEREHKRENIGSTFAS